MMAVIVALLPCDDLRRVPVWRGTPSPSSLVSVLPRRSLSEWLFRLALRSSPTSVGDLSAVVTGLLLALVLPPSTPLWMVAILGAVMAIVVAKEFFGGLGQNPFNPALIGRAFLLMSFPGRDDDLAQALQGIVDAATNRHAAQYGQAGRGHEGCCRLGRRASDVGGFYWQLFLGNRAGSLGETSILLVTRRRPLSSSPSG